MATTRYTSKELFDWMSEKARSAASMRDKLMRLENQQRSTTTIGRMFFFKYDPKTKDKLPIYDIYPLVFPMEQYNDGFLGLNIHYLDVSARTGLLSSLQEYATAKKYTERTRLQISYDVLNSSKSVRSVMSSAVKRYLFSHVRSRFVEIPATEWDKAAQLSLELFIRKG
jgi:hypothetical protein